MTEQEIHKLLEIQYLKGRLDELHKAYPTITNMDRSRKLDVRIQKYYDKLKNTDEMAYHLYQVERLNQRISKDKSKEFMKSLLEELIPYLTDNELIQRVKKQISKY
jgi:ubiquinone biosynthesis protein Coq4